MRMRDLFKAAGLDVDGGKAGGWDCVCLCIHAHTHTQTHTHTHTHTVTLRRAELPSGASNVSLMGSDHDEVIVWGLGFKV